MKHFKRMKTLSTLTLKAKENWGWMPYRHGGHHDRHKETEKRIDPGKVSEVR